MLGVDFGNAEAPARILEFFDFGCGYCRKFHKETLPTLAEKYIDEGSVFWKAVPFVIGNWANSVPATLAAECALGQGTEQYELMAEALFDRQSDWKQASEPEPVLEGIAADLGLDMEAFRTCMTSDEFLWRVQAHTSLARQIGVRGTPTFVVVGYAPFSGALPLELFEQIVDTVLVNAAADTP
jgi:protein-disulfide isomerase